jgi:hypothetical protein
MSQNNTFAPNQTQLTKFVVRPNPFAYFITYFHKITKLTQIILQLSLKDLLITQYIVKLEWL